jgi:hypothetical protein
VRQCVVGFWLLLTSAIAGCSIVDSSMESRIAAVNSGYDSAINNEILLNISRASYFQPLRFYSHNKIAPSQTSDVKIGLPNITFGPAQTVAEHQYVFSTMTDNSAALSLELDPIETRDFHNSILTPISVGTIGLLLESFPKELVFQLLFDSIRYQEKGKPPIEYKNEPVAPSTICPSGANQEFDPMYAGPDDEVRNSPYHPPGAGAFVDLTNCRYQRFVYWVETGVAYGLSVDYEEVPNPLYDSGDAKSTQPKTKIAGHFCFDPAQAQSKLAYKVANLPTSTCEQKTDQSSSDQSITSTNQAVQDILDAAKAIMTAGKQISAPGEQIASAGDKLAAAGRKLAGGTQAASPSTPSNQGGSSSENGSDIYFPFVRDAKEVEATIGIRPRSLLGVFLYLGRVLASETTGVNPVTLYSATENGDGDKKILTVVRGAGPDKCFASTYAPGGQLCVPLEGADNSKRVFAIVSELISLSSTASDIPTSLTVRLTP